MTSTEKVLLYNGKPTHWPMFRTKATAKVRASSLGWVPKLAASNQPEVQARGQAELEAWLAADETGTEEKGQNTVYSLLVLAVADAVPEVVTAVDEDELRCGTLLWDALLRKYQPGARSSRARMVMQLANHSMSWN
mmetsp:Transcript_67815/g.141411  ORF Transcript_67815/g.141411 Transcript_67815/m.141411 type:complete len:136 (-) Transcript_67815:391-798(-)